MNKYEKLMLGWISDTTGLKKESIKFSNNSSPDFITPEGYGYEVKVLKKLEFTIDLRQWQSLHELGECSILLCSESGKLIDVIPINLLPIGTTKWHDFKIRMTNFGKGRMRRKDFLAQFKIEEYCSSCYHHNGKLCNCREVSDMTRKIPCSDWYPKEV
ncbi:MAG: hypothetical protein ACFFDI_26430 [Promethearchaeota archaeon]